MEKIYYSYEDISAATGFPIGTLSCWVSRKQIPHYRFGGRNVKFNMMEVLEWCERHKIEDKVFVKKKKR